MISKYIQLRDRKREMEQRHKDELRPYTDMMLQLEGRLLAELDRAGVNSMKAPGGTVYRAVRTSATVQDWDRVFAFIRRHELWELLEARVSKTAALAVIEERGEPIPGIAIARAATLNVRRA
jgi:hypothetical protein